VVKVKTFVTVKQLLALLNREYGIPEWKLNHAPISVLVQTILSQNTSDINSRRAFESLLASFGSWENVADADSDAIEHAIRCGGLGRMKAKRIKEVLREIERKRGKLELDFLSRILLSEARDWLEQLPGVGVKTASCVLLFSLGMTALPVDTHILRVSKRLGLINSSESAVKAHQLLEKLVPWQDVYQFHILMIEHGRTACQARHPLCQNCVLKEMCPSYAVSVAS